MPDGTVVTLPAATTAGQIITVWDSAGTSATIGLTVNAGAGDTLVQLEGVSNTQIEAYQVISDGNHHWYVLIHD
jgi:hypothetical protein